jgi:hypothetical protein
MGIKGIGFLLLTLVSICLCFNSKAQVPDSLGSSNGLKKLDLAFIDFLINNQEHEDALLILKERLNNKSYHHSQIDSIFFYTAWAFYNLKLLDSSIVYFEKIKVGSPFYIKSKFYEHFEHIYLKQYAQADEKLAQFEVDDSTLVELKKFQQATSAILQRDFLRFETIGQSFKYNNFSSVEEQKELYKRKEEILKNKRKSPLLAGLMSAVIPGTGKFYAGYQGQAISAMVPTFIFAAAAAESYYRAGPKSAQFITAASLFGIFYVGNIWGSVLSVKTFYELKNNEIHNNVMLDLHIPLRRIFSN